MTSFNFNYFPKRSHLQKQSHWWLRASTYELGTGEGVGGHRTGQDTTQCVTGSHSHVHIRLEANLQH